MKKSISKFRDSLRKVGFSRGILEPDEYFDTGNYAFNHYVSDGFYKGVPNARSVTLMGKPSSGKSMMAAKIAADAQKKGYFILWLDAEQASNETSLRENGIDTDDESFDLVNIHNIEDGIKIVKELKDEFTTSDKKKDTSEDDEEIPRVFVVIDSVSSLEPQIYSDEIYSKGEAKDDQGRKAKKIKTLVSELNYLVSMNYWGCVFVFQCYDNTDIYTKSTEGNTRPSGGNSGIYIPSIVLETKSKDLQDEKKNPIGFQMIVQTRKNRFFKTRGSKITLNVPQDTGLDPYEGLLDIFEEQGCVTRKAAWLSYTDVNGQVHKFQKKDFMKHADNIMYMLDKSNEMGDNSEIEDTPETDESVTEEQNNNTGV